MESNERQSRLVHFLRNLAGKIPSLLRLSRTIVRDKIGPGILLPVDRPSPGQREAGVGRRGREKAQDISRRHSAAGCQS